MSNLFWWKEADKINLTVARAVTALGEFATLYGQLSPHHEYLGPGIITLFVGGWIYLATSQLKFK